MEQKDIKIIVVDDNVVFRKVMMNFLQNEYHYNIIGEASCAKDFFALANIHMANIILMDLQMPETDGYILTKEILKEYCYMKIIAVTMHTDKAYLKELINVGFRGCVFKPDFYMNVQEAIVTVHDNKYYFPRDIRL